MYIIWPFKYQVSTVARALSNLKAHCGQCCPIHPLEVKGRRGIYGSKENIWTSGGGM
jgi:hypothetical protein